MKSIKLTFNNTVLFDCCSEYYVDFIHKKFSISMRNQVISGSFSYIRENSVEVIIRVTDEWYSEFIKATSIETIGCSGSADNFFWRWLPI